MIKATEPPAPIRLSTNCIWENKFYTAGEVLPVASAADLTDNLRPLVVTGEIEPEEPNEARGSFELGALYRVTDDGRLGRRLQRQAAEMEAAAQEDDWIEEQVANAELPPPEIVEGLEEEHRRHVDLQKAQRAADARRADETSDAAATSAAPPELFVRRGSRHYVEIHRTRLKPDEPVFTKDPTDGAYQCIGMTDARAEPPDIPISL